MTVYCQNCGKDTAGQPLSFYGNVICSEECKKLLSERVYFRDIPPEAGSTWFCPHCAAENPLGDPREELRPDCMACGKGLDPGSAAPPKKGGCMGVLLLALCAVGIAGCFGSGETVQRSGSGVRPAWGPLPASMGAVPQADMDPFVEPRAAVLQSAETDGPAYRYGAKFEPPDGRIIHGMGQWALGNEEYLQMLGDHALEPASKLYFFPLGDWPRPWDTLVDQLEYSLSLERQRGRVPHLELSLFGIRVEGEGKQSIDHEIARGDYYDARIRDLARRIRDVGGPIFVRIGGEFNGAWFGYHSSLYPIAYRRIVEMFRDEGAHNAAFVWCYEPSAPGDFDASDAHGMRWFPGPDVIDWFGLDVFDTADFSGSHGRSGLETKLDRSERFLRMAEKYGKPVIIAETSATKQVITADDVDGRRDWDEWFVPFFKFLERHPNIKAFHYVNTDWRKSGNARALGWQDASINNNAYLSRRYIAEMQKPRYLHKSDVPLLNGYAEAMALGKGPVEKPLLPSGRTQR